MLKTFQKCIAACAVASLAIAPVAAQAGTRAGDSTAVYTPAASQPGEGRGAEGERLAGAGLGEIFAIIIATLWATGVVFVGVDAADDGDNNQSPGAN